MAVITLKVQDYGPGTHTTWSMLDITVKRWDIDHVGYREWHEVLHYRFDVGRRVWVPAMAPMSGTAGARAPWLQGGTR